MGAVVGCEVGGTGAGVARQILTESAVDDAKLSEAVFVGSVGGAAVGATAGAAAGNAMFDNSN